MDLAPLHCDWTYFVTQGPISAVADVYKNLVRYDTFLVHSFQQILVSEPNQNKNGIMFYLQNRTE